MKMAIKDWLGLLVAISLLAVMIMLVIIHGSSGFEILAPIPAILALVFLFAGMMSQYLVWRSVVNGSVGGIPDSLTFSSHALTIWGKYIPGKIWSVVGRASMLAYYSKERLPKLMTASTISQLYMIIAGIIVAFPLLMAQYITVDDSNIHLIIMLLGFAMLMLISIILFLKRDYIKSTWTGLSTRILVPLVHGVLAWLFWGIGFHNLLSASGYMTSLVDDVSVFATGTIAGILAVVAPGGLGIRESAITVLLNLRGMDWGSAATTAIAARVWFAMGEGFIFILGWQVRRYETTRDRTGGK